MTFTLLVENIVRHPGCQPRDTRRRQRAKTNDSVMSIGPAARRLTSCGEPPIDRRRKVPFGEPVAEYSRRRLDAVALARERKTCTLPGPLSNTPVCKRDGNSI